MTTFIRYQAGEERRSPSGRFGPLTTEHPGVGLLCCVCDLELQEGDVPTLFAIGPLNPEEAEKADAGKWYNALAAIGHEKCLWP